jgi:hypothetical protein
MPPPKSKATILKRLQAERRRLERNLSALSREEMLEPGAVGAWSVKDVLAHLADWEARMPVWVAAARRGEHFQTPDPDLDWKHVDLVNQRIYEKHRDQPLDAVLAEFRAGHEQFMAMVEAMPEEEILERGRYEFTGGAAVYDWLQAYAAHDLWGKTKIRAWVKARQPG